MIRALVLDFGGPVLRTPFELLRGGEARAGLPDGSLDWWGPFAPERDAAWRDMQAGAMTEREYWQRNAEQFAQLSGAEPTFRGLMDVLFAAPEAELVRPEARAAVVEARAAGLEVAVCTNDMEAFHGRAWVEGLELLRHVGVVVDGSVEHILKPDPRIYALVLARLGIDAGACLFVDDQPGNVAGAEAAGMQTVLFDVTAPEQCWKAIRAHAGVPG